MPVPSQDTKKQSCLVFSDVEEDTEHELKTERDCITIFVWLSQVIFIIVLTALMDGSYFPDIIHSY